MTSSWAYRYNSYKLHDTHRRCS